MTLTLELSSKAASSVQSARARGINIESAVSQWLENMTLNPQPAWGARVVSELQAEGVIGMWSDRPESGEELALEFRRMAETRAV